VEQSVMQIQGQGTFIDSGGAAAYNAGFTGTGFAISEGGLAVTNNHVVQGAATLDVSFSDGESLNARITAVSECSDLAIIDLEGDGYTPLSFRKDPITVGLDVFSAGFPAADEIDFDNLDFTLTSGIVGSTNAGGELSWASVDGVLQHDAQILGGNSGGPLVDENGEVIGINGEAQQFDSGLSGIFISSVESGSPADRAGIEPGDVLITIENLVVATDGTMSDYCDVLRTQGDDSTMDVEIYRPSLDLALSGQINGGPIELPLIAATVLGDDTDGPADSGTSAPIGAPYSYTEVTDDQGLISVSIPTEWTEVDGTPNPNFGPSVWASPDIAGWRDTWAVPGIIVESAPGRNAADIGALLLERDFSGVCDALSSEPYEDPLYAGTLQIYGNCGGTDTHYIILAAAPLNAGYLVRVEVQAPKKRYLEAADKALATFVANI
jgi:serine protease Do